MEPVESSDPRASSGAIAAKNNHGGMRSGAGAPKGNLNALKHGHYSAKARAVRRALLELAKIPEVKEVVEKLSRRP